MQTEFKFRLPEEMRESKLNSKRIIISLSSQQINALKDIRQKASINVSDLIKNIIDDYIKYYDNSKNKLDN